jgi:DNA-binding NarL/FixJ family response regulator
MIQVIVAEDHHLVREAIILLLEREEDINVVAEVADGQEAVNAVIRLVPDVLVIDISMPNMSGILATEEIRKADLPTQVVILSVHFSRTFVIQALEAGALGYVAKGSVSAELLKAIRFASQGKRFINEHVAALAREVPAIPEGFRRLTLRERQVLQLIAEGHVNRQIAEILSLHIKTVEKHRASLIEKLGVRDVPALVQIALSTGLISLNE